MRLVVDTNVLISGLLVESSLPAQLIVLWRTGWCQLLTSAEQIDELHRMTRYPKLRARLPAALAGRLVNDVRKLATLVGPLPTVTACADPHDNYLLALASAGRADFLVSGDKRDLLALKRFDGVPIVTVRELLTQFGRKA